MTKDMDLPRRSDGYKVSNLIVQNTGRSATTLCYTVFSFAEPIVIFLP